MPTLKIGQTHWNNLLAVADELFECVWPFCGIGTLRVKTALKRAIQITAEETGDLISNKVTHKLLRSQKLPNTLI